MAVFASKAEQELFTRAFAFLKEARIRQAAGVQGEVIVSLRDQGKEGDVHDDDRLGDRAGVPVGEVSA